MNQGHSGPNRRQVLAGLAAVSFARPGSAAPFELTAAPATAQLAPADFAPTPVWAFNGTIPGPLLRGKQGARMQVRVTNRLFEATSVHWHGLRLENAMDGVPHMTQPPIGPGASFDYDFRLPDAGTYWYHSHSRSYEQVARGLQGPLIIDEAAPPEVDADEVLVLDDWRFEADATLSEGFGAVFDKAHGGRIGNWVTVNGVAELVRATPRGARLRLRLINTANGRIFSLRLSGMAASVVALDGQPVEAPYAVEALTLAPAQRADLIVDITADEGAEALILSREREGDFALVSLPVVAGAAPRSTPVPRLPANPAPRLSALPDVPVRPLVMDGGAMRGLPSAQHRGEELDGRALAERGLVWAFNGHAGMPAEPFAEVPRGTPVRIAMQNDTRWPHGMHLHGHHFHEVTDGRPGAYRDTTLIAPGETREIAFLADNPGSWLLHCHMLEHAAGGMMTRIEVT
jgi:FtsP/CotA-like multicopper oxidase with cupredoxin domain